MAEKLDRFRRMSGGPNPNKRITVLEKAMEETLLDVETLETAVGAPLAEGDGYSGGIDNGILYNDGNTFATDSGLTWNGNSLSAGDFSVRPLDSAPSIQGIYFKGTTGSNWQIAANSSVTYIGASNNVQIWSNGTYRGSIQAAGWHIGDSQISPSAKLHTSLSTNVVGNRIDLSNGQTEDAFQINSYGNTGGDLFKVSASGNVGIGTSSPNQALHVLGNIRVGADGNNSIIYLTGETDGNWYIQTGFSAGIGSYGTRFSQHSSGDANRGWTFYDAAANVNRAWIKSLTGDAYFAGNVGIGTSSPSAKLHTNLNTDQVGHRLDLSNGQTADAFQINSYGNTGGDLFRVESDANLTISNTVGNHLVSFKSHGESRVRMFSGGSSDNKASLTYYVNGGGLGSAYGEIGINNSYDSNLNVGGALAFDTRGGIAPIRMFVKAASSNPSLALAIDSTGNVGIGTSSPSAKLHVVGNLQTSGYIYNGRIFINNGWIYNASTTQGYLDFNTANEIKSWNSTLIANPNADRVALKLNLSNGQTADAFQINSYGNTGGDLFKVESDGKTYIKGSASTNSLEVGNGYIKTEQGFICQTSSAGRTCFDAYSGSPSSYFLGRGSGNNYFQVSVLGTVIRTSGTTAINSSAALEVQSTSKGLLPPRMTTTQRDAISSPATGLSIFNTSTSQPEYYSGTAWEGAAGGGISIGDSIGGASVSQVLFTDVSGLLAQNSKFVFDGSTLNFTGASSSNTTNSSFGVNAGNSNSGTGNTSIGNSANNNSTGNGLTSVGNASGVQAVSDFSVYIGDNSGYQSSGNRNVFAGYLSGRQNNGQNSVGIGDTALFSTTGNQNTAIGSNSLSSGSGSGHVALGYGSLLYGTGNNNVAVGYYAGFNQTGTRVLAIGYQAGQNNTQNNRVIIGQTNLPKFTGATVADADAAAAAALPAASANGVYLYWNAVDNTIKARP